MELNSDGNIDFRSKKTTNQTTTVKKRCSSVGTINISKDEINKIIGTNLNPRPVKTYLDKPVQKTKNAQGDKKAIGHTRTSESFSVDDVNLSQDILFKPRNSVARTPPQTTSTANKQQDSITKGDDNDVFNNESTYSLNMNTQKRSRSNSSPTTSEKNKIKRPNTETCMEVGSALDKHCCSTKNSTENILNEVLDSLQRIQQNIDLMPLDEARKTSSDLFIVHKHVTNLAFRIGQVEKTNLELNNKIKDLLADIKTVPSDPNMPQYQKNDNTLFSEGIKRVPASNNPKASSVITEWKTPPPQPRKHETVVKIKGQNDPRIVIQELKQNLRVNNLEASFKRIRPMQSGSVVIECSDATQQLKLKETLEKNIKHIEIKNASNLDPMVMITGILKGYTPEMFIHEFIADNPDIINTFGQEVKNQFKYITRRGCKNNTKENWIFQTPPAIFKWLIRNNNLVFDLCPAYVQEYTNVALCFKCCLFGHVAKHCTTDECCHKCGGTHNATQCTVDTFDCPNCKRSNLPKGNHSARDPSCPVYVQRIRRIQQQTNYSTGESFLAEK